MKRIMMLSMVILSIFVYGTASGKEVYKILQKYCPDCKPFVFGALTPEPTLAIVVPDKLWKRLSPNEKKELYKYMEKLIRKAKRNPDYFLLHDVVEADIEACRRGIRLCQFYKRAIRNMDDRDWKILTGRYYRKSHRVFLDRVEVCGEDVSNCE